MKTWIKKLQIYYLKHPALKKARPEAAKIEEVEDSIATVPTEETPLLAVNYV